MLAGVDEAGRGALFGPVVAASVILPVGYTSTIFSDSKQLTAIERDRLFSVILQDAVAVSVGLCSARYIDQVNVLKATLVAMRKSIHKLKINPSEVIIDGNKVPPGIRSAIRVQSRVKADQSVPSVSAASIIAKVVRDRLMLKYHKRYTQFRFDVHKGYATEQHYSEIESYGPTPFHRASFRLFQQKSLFE